LIRITIARRYLKVSVAPHLYEPDSISGLVYQEAYLRAGRQLAGRARGPES
jgi:hypothetical protein